jgi:hypothetical protein
LTTHWRRRNNSENIKTKAECWQVSHNDWGMKEMSEIRRTTEKDRFPGCGQWRRRTSSVRPSRTPCHEPSEHS